MISDVLAEAVEQIDLYLSDTTSSTAYVGPIRDRLVWLRNGMELVRQELYGLLLAHFAIRALMHEAALRGGEDPDRLSFLHAVRVVRRRLSTWHAIPPSGADRVS